MCGNDNFQSPFIGYLIESKIYNKKKGKKKRKRLYNHIDGLIENCLI